MAEEWQLVSRRRGKPRVTATSSTAAREEVVEPVAEVSQHKQKLITRRVRAIADVLAVSKLLQDALQVIGKQFELKAQGGDDHKAPVDVGNHVTLVGYGLGSFCASSNAVHQLGLLVALTEALGEHQSAEIFDPAMNKSDVAIAGSFQLKVLQENEHGKRRVQGRTVFFMPHCGKALYQNVLACNWGSAIQDVVVIGNSFSAYGDRVLAAKERQELVLVDVLPYLEEVPLSCGVSKTHDEFARYEAAFNDLSVHSFPSSLVERALLDSRLKDKMAALTSATYDEQAETNWPTF